MQVQSGKLTMDDYLERLRQGIKHDSLLAVTLNKRVRDSHWLALCIARLLTVCARSLACTGGSQ